MLLDKLKTKLHDLMDPLWEQGLITRDALYEKLSELLGRDAHVSNMTREEIAKCAKFVREMRKGAFPCYACIHNITEADGFPLCRKHEDMKGVCCGSYEARGNFSKISGSGAGRANVG